MLKGKHVTCWLQNKNQMKQIYFSPQLMILNRYIILWIHKNSVSLYESLYFFVYWFFFVSNFQFSVEKKNWKKGETLPKSYRMSHHRIQRIREPYRRSFKLLSTKTWNLVFFDRRSITGGYLFVCFLIFAFLFFSGVIVSTQWS